MVDLDGSQHYTEEGIISDAIRGELLSALDLEVIRFGNLEVDRNFESVCQEIHRAVQRRVSLDVSRRQITRP